LNSISEIPASALTGFGNPVRHTSENIAGALSGSHETVGIPQMPAAPEVLEFDPVHLLIEDSVGDIPPEINDFFDKLLDPFASGHTHGAEERGEPELQPCVC
jgi:hypothetical protein